MSSILVERTVSLDSEFECAIDPKARTRLVASYCACLRTMQLLCTVDASLFKNYAPLLIPLLTAAQVRQASIPKLGNPPE
jgi:hypothetical protein